MTLQVPYLAVEAIERDAEALLAQFAHARGMAIRAPIPIEDIIEKHLKFHIEFDDLHRLLGVPRGGSGRTDIFGAIWFETGKIVIDESLDPEERPSIEGRYRYTLAHEGGGHGRLHRPLVQANRAQGSRQPTVICRSSRAKERVELQANLYASCLLMPRKLVFQAWRDWFGNDHPLVLWRKDGTIDVDKIIRMLPKCVVSAVISHSFNPVCDDQLRQHFARPFAEQFLVSPTAMRIRLEMLGLLHRKDPRQQHDPFF